MAASCVLKSETLLDRTLSGLKSTSKGQLKYNGDVGFNDRGSEQFVCTLESYLCRSPESIKLLSNTSFNQDQDEDEDDPELEQSSSNVSANNALESERSGTELSPSGVSSRNVSSTLIAENFESQNELCIKDYHEETKVIADKEKNRRELIFERRTQNLARHTAKYVELWQQEFDEENRRMKCEMMERERENFEEMKRKKEQLDREAMEHKGKLDEILRKAIIEESHLVKEEKKRKELMENLKNEIQSLYNNILHHVDSIQKKFKDFPYMSFIAGVSYKGVTDNLSQVITRTEAVFKNASATTELSVAETHLKDMVKLFELTTSIEKNVEIILKMAEDSAIEKKKQMEEAKIKQEELKKEELFKAAQKVVEKSQKSVEDQPHIDRKLRDLTSKVLTEKQPGEKRCISDEAFSQYTKFQKLLKDTQDAIKDFASDPKQTKYKFDLYKAINVPINALSAQSPSHLKDKIYSLVTILSGDNVTVGGKTVNCNSHPAAMAFCKNLVAKKLVMQGAQQVSSNPSSAFIFAAVIVGIWSAFPDVGQLILAHFHQSYPYLVPYYLPLQENQSNEDYHKALGYSIVQGKIEGQDKFLKKFSGTVQLYAAVVTSSGADKPDHPHGIEQGWTWLARVLNLRPHPGITATMLYHFINVSGHMLMKKYGKQFQKLLLVLCRDFVPSMDKVTPPERRGPGQRLKDFLEESIRMKRIPVPEGYLTERWWHSGHF